jgi:hypothetical protein
MPLAFFSATLSAIGGWRFEYDEERRDESIAVTRFG